MRDPNDLWYVRLPDGRVVRAKSTRALRYHLQTGRVPWNSLVRRDPAEEWATLDWTPEFADLEKERQAPDSSPGAKEKGTPAPSKKLPTLRAVGVRGLVEELLTALEGSFNQVKLFLAAGMGLAVSLAWIGCNLCVAYLEYPMGLAAGLGWAALMLVPFHLAGVIITRMTVLELARLRPARVREVRVGLLPRTFRLLVSQILVCGLVVGLLFALYWFEARNREAGVERLPDWLQGLLAAARLVMELICLPVLGLSFLLAPVLIVEETGLWGTLSRWWSLLRGQLGRLLVYEALALAVGLIVAFPFLGPVAFSAWLEAPEPGLPSLVRAHLLIAFAGLALTPFLVFFTVANVNIYLNVQYEFYSSTRKSKTP